MTAETLVTFLLDKSGSMLAIKEPTMEAFNAYTGELKKDGEGIVFSLVQFDSLSTVTTWKSLPVSQVGVLDHSNYQPQGGTPLIDAAFKTIKAVERKAAEYATPPKVVICIQTDGEENSSREHSWDDLNALIKEKIGLGWQFNFMGAGIDAYKQGQRMGIAVASTVSYDHTNLRATMDSFSESAMNIRSFASGASANTAYSTAQKMRAGDKYDPGVRGPMASPAPTPPLTGLKASVEAGRMKAQGVKSHVDDIEL